MNSFYFSSQQEEILNQPIHSQIFLEGPPGCGKTTTAAERMMVLIESGIPPEQILILVPQRTLAFPYYDALRRPDFPPGGSPTVLTIGGLARRLIELFWPAISHEAGFGYPDQQPGFLTLETAQYYMAHIVSPLLDEGYFDSVELDRNRLYSQVIDNLNKAAAIGFPYTTIGERLKRAWIGKPTQVRIYEEAQECANRFRNYCLEHNLLDFSLQLEIFTHHLWTLDLCQEYLLQNYRHIIYDNIEEDVPIAHDILSEWLPNFDSALLVYDTDGGYRSYLGADPASGHELKELCQRGFVLNQSFITSDNLNALQNGLSDCIQRREMSISRDIRSDIEFAHHQFYPQMVETVCERISWLIEEEHVPPGEIVVLAPYLTDSLRFSLMRRLDQFRIPYWSHRPSRSLRDEPATQCLLTLAKLAHPNWNHFCSQHELRYALIQSISELDLVRADILSKIVFREAHPEDGLYSFGNIHPDMQERITYTIGEKYEELRRWIQDYQNDMPVPLDIFISKIFGEILSQSGFGFHDDFDAANVAARLVESVQKFRWSTGASLENENIPIGQEYIQMVSEGVIAAQYLQSWSSQPDDAVLLAPAFTFLMTNRPTSYQFWLDIGAISWWERLEQPLTHPHVLSRQWPADTVWTDVDEYNANQKTLERLVRGLIRRCQKGIYLYTTDTNEQGNQQRGPLLQALQILLRRQHQEWGVEDV